MEWQKFGLQRALDTKEQSLAFLRRGFMPKIRAIKMIFQADEIENEERDISIRFSRDQLERARLNDG